MFTLQDSIIQCLYKLIVPTGYINALTFVLLRKFNLKH